MNNKYCKRKTAKGKELNKVNSPQLVALAEVRGVCTHDDPWSHARFQPQLYIQHKDNMINQLYTQMYSSYSFKSNSMPRILYL